MASPADLPPHEYRRALRRQLLEQRLLLNPADIQIFSERIQWHVEQRFSFLSKQRVGFCWPMKNEPDLRPLMERWLAFNYEGFEALLPVVVAKNEPLRFRRWGRGAAMEEDCYGIPTPAEGIFRTPEALLLPVNGFDEAGYRLGYGGGFFDRTLASLTPSPLAIGIGFEVARVETIHPEPHDMPLDAMVTEQGVFCFSARAKSLTQI